MPGQSHTSRKSKPSFLVRLLYCTILYYPHVLVDVLCVWCLKPLWLPLESPLLSYSKSQVSSVNSPCACHLNPGTIILYESAHVHLPPGPLAPWPLELSHPYRFSSSVNNSLQPSETPLGSPVSQLGFKILGSEKFGG